MALDMVIELERTPDWRAIKDAATKTGVHDLESFEEGLSFCFDKSGSSAWTRDTDRLTEISAEGRHGCDFLTQNRLIVRVNPSMYDESVNDIHDFLNHLSKLSPMQFVMSFQGEEVRAVRNKKGFEFFWNNPR